MKSGALKVIAHKEILDHVRSRKFLLIFGIFLIISMAGLVGGLIEYQEQLDSYNDRLSVVSEDEMSYAPYWKPSLLTIFYQISMLVISLGGALGIAMGFDLITKEKESKSLKILLSNPIYRDEVINGKALGAIGALLIALGIVAIISLAIMLIFGIVPDADQFGRMLIFGAAAFLMIFSYFAISLFMSTISSDSGNALIYSLIILIFLSTLLPVFAYGPVMNLVAGVPPEPPESLMKENMELVISTSGTIVSSEDGSGEYVEYIDPNQEEWDKFSEKSQAYWEKRQAISDTIGLISPSGNFQKITMEVITSASVMPMYMDEEFEKDTSLGGILSDLLQNIIALLVIPAIFFGAAYVRFMRLDIR
ncbi:MAG: ABC transporter permease [Methanogenium sp.]|nr:ABC transporter permease [Methanogenium sp.]